MSPPPGPGLSTPEGLRLARQLLRPQLPHDVHDFILEGLCKAIDGIHVLSVLPTGAGKTGYFYGFILLLRALKKLSPPPYGLFIHSSKILLTDMLVSPVRNFVTTW
jgi:hypothetical protein